MSVGARVLGLCALVAAASFAVGTMAAGGSVGRGAGPLAARPLERDVSVELFAADFDRVLRTDSVLYRRWKELNPDEAAAYEEYVELARRTAWPRPEMRTPFGRALVTAASIATGDVPSRPEAKTVPERS